MKKARLIIRFNSIEIKHYGRIWGISGNYNQDCAITIGSPNPSIAQFLRNSSSNWLNMSYTRPSLRSLLR